MATATLPVPTRGDLTVDDVDHLYCCDENVAMCGVDLTDVAEEVFGEDDPLCPMCALVDETGMPCPVPGCQP